MWGKQIWKWPFPDHCNIRKELCSIYSGFLILFEPQAAMVFHCEVLTKKKKEAPPTKKKLMTAQFWPPSRTLSLTPGPMRTSPDRLLQVLHRNIFVPEDFLLLFILLLCTVAWASDLNLSEILVFTLWLCGWPTQRYVRVQTGFLHTETSPLGARSGWGLFR